MQKLMTATLMLIMLSGCALGAPGSKVETDISITEDATPTVSLEMICQQKGYNWNAIDSSCSYTQEGNPTIDIHYPIELVSFPLIEATMDSYLSNYRAQFDENFAESGANSPGAWQLSLTYTIYQHGDTIISVEWVENYYTGGAHPGLEYTTFTFDSATGQIITFPDLFADGVDPVDAVMQMTRDKLVEVLADASSIGQINDGTDEISDYENFVLSDTALIILFEPYRVAAGAAGPSRIELPLSELGDLLQAQYR